MPLSPPSPRSVTTHFSAGQNANTSRVRSASRATPTHACSRALPGVGGEPGVLRDAVWPDRVRPRSPELLGDRCCRLRPLLVGVGQGRFDATGEVLDRLGELGDRSSPSSSLHSCLLRHRLAADVAAAVACYELLSCARSASARRTEASISTRRLETLSTLIPNGTPSVRQYARRAWDPAVEYRPATASTPRRCDPSRWRCADACCECEPTASALKSKRSASSASSAGITTSSNLCDPDLCDPGRCLSEHDHPGALSEPETDEIVDKHHAGPPMRRDSATASTAPGSSFVDRGDHAARKKQRPWGRRRSRLMAQLAPDPWSKRADQEEQSSRNRGAAWRRLRREPRHAGAVGGRDDPVCPARARTAREPPRATKRLEGSCSPRRRG